MKKKELYKKVLPQDPLLHPLLKRTLIMFNWSLILTFLLSTQVYAISYPQSARVDLNLKSTTLKKALSVLEQRGDIRLLYSEEFLPKKEVSLVSKDMPVLDALSEILKETDLNYRVFGDGLVVIISPQGVVIQDLVVRGTVTDLQGEPLIGVSVRLQGTTTGVATDLDGNFSIQAPENGVLEFSYIGFVSKNVPVGGMTSLQVQLEEDSRSLNEVIVTGYTREQKKDIIGSVAIVNTDDLLATPSGNVTNQLEGRAPGVTVSGNGDPSSSAKVRIRGYGSFAGSEPLYIIDGVPSSSTDGNVRGAIDNLNPNDIESVQVLKDAASASVYGARAANGVVIITTKRGKIGDPKIAVDSYYGINYVDKSRFPDLLNAQEYGDMLWKSYTGAGLKVGDSQWGNRQYGFGATPVIPEYIFVNDNGTRYGGADLEALRISDPSKFASLTDPANYSYTTHQIVRSGNTNWADEIYNTAPLQNYQVTASGGSDKGVYALSLNYFNQKNTATKIAYLDRYSLRANSSFNVRDNIRIGENIQVSYTDNKFGYGVWNFTPQSLQSIIPVYDIMGNPASTAAPSTGSARNPVTESALQAGHDRNYNYGIFGNAYLEVDLLKNLTARTSFGIDYSSGFVSNYNSRTFDNSEPTNIYSLSVDASSRTAWTWTNTLNYNHTFAELHNVKFLLGSEAVKTFRDNVMASRNDYNVDPLHPNDDFLVINTGTGMRDNSGVFTRETLYSLFGRVDYMFSDKYLLNATLRRDGSSKFGANNRIGYFPAVGLGWRLSSEEFMRNIEWLNDLKLRGSWGIIGNQSGLSNTNQYSLYESNINYSYPLNGSNNSGYQSYVPSTVGNPNARWEKTTTTNIGLDASIFSGSINITFDWFNKKTTDLLVQNQAPLTGETGPNSPIQPYVNIGDISNKGIELGINRRGNISEDLRYDATLTFSKNKNEVLRVLESSTSFIEGNRTRTQAGYPISYFYGYQIEGFFNTQDEVDAYNAKVESTWLQPEVGRWKIKDVNGDNIVNNLDMGYIGSPHPDFQAGLNLSLAYKNFDVTGFLFWSQGGNIFNEAGINTDFFSGDGNNRSRRMLYDSWTPENMNAKLPKLDINDTYSFKYPTDYSVEDASYLRLKTLQVGYNFSKAGLDKLKLEKLRVYVQGQNLFTSTKFSGMDPVGGQGGSDISMGIYNHLNPTPQQFLFGINLVF